ncbi:MAG: ATP-dependent DNA helicase RecG [Treponema sp.]|nr:ATP-dependent DNA helicase RecG [Treponema sp.]
MFLRELIQPLNTLRNVGDSVKSRLSDAGITSIASLLTRYPRNWEDRSRNVPLKDWNKGQVCTVAKVIAHNWFWFGAKKTLKIEIEDQSARAALVCFNRPFLKNQLPIGKEVNLWGRFYCKFNEIMSTSFEIGIPGSKNTIAPVYPLTKNLTQNLLRRLTQQALDQYCTNLEDELPQKVILNEKLLKKADAIKTIHFPSSMEILEKARNTLIYEELFYLEIMVGRRSLERKKDDRGEEQKHACGLSPLQQRFIERLPFTLTQGQVKAIEEINEEMSRPWPLARLIQGDVGSGKTLVAFLAALRVVDQGGQAAIMAPTELLARQHADNAARLLEPLGVRPAYLTGNLKYSGRTQLLKNLAAGEIDIVLGTHALFSKDVVYQNLNLAIIDEQHRFGVTQRQAIIAKGQNSLQKKGIPGLIMMSATPIPRTLALTVFGDLDVTVISDMPPGRKPIKTHLSKESNAQKVYNFVRKELESGRQAYFVYPLIGQTTLSGQAELPDGNSTDDEEGLKDAVSMADKLAKEIYPQYSTALIHSKIDDEEKRKTMDAFRKGEIRILAATSVVEVGVDVPNASCMVIHHAERFGLSALHQLRGRVGRGSDQSYCFLIYSDQEDQPGINPEELSEEERSREGKRLMVMLENSDGFVIAEKDLLFRGPGQIAGIEQSGYLKLGIADPVRDADALVRARTDAFSILETDPDLLQDEHHCIAAVLDRAPPFSEVGL